MNNSLKYYPGAKAGSGICQWLINNIPYHTRYYELFAGSAQLYAAKQSAGYNWLSDINPKVCKALKEKYPTAHVGAIPAHIILNNETFLKDDFIYLDPPYHRDDRRSGAAIYDYELLGDDDHAQLLQAIRTMETNIMISCGTNQLYATILKGWRRKEMQVVGHREIRTEVIYMNYPEPTYLHEYTHLGDNYVKRQALLRKRQRMAQNISHLPAYQKHLLIQELINNDPAAVQHFMAVRSGKHSQ